MKESFLLYKSFYEPIKNLTLEQKGKLFDSIFEYQINKIEPEINSDIFMAFLFFKNQFRLDDLKYQNVIDRNKNNGLKGGRPKEPKKPNGLKTNPKNPKNPSEPKKPDNDNDNDNDNVKDNEKVKDNIFKTINHLKISIEENQKLINLGYSQEMVNDIYDRIENYKDNKKYTSLFLTAKNWLKLDADKNKPIVIKTPDKIKIALKFIDEPEQIVTREERDILKRDWTKPIEYEREIKQ